jgi:hypothetical protein
MDDPSKASGGSRRTKEDDLPDQIIEAQIAHWREYLRHRRSPDSPERDPFEQRLHDELARLAKAGLAGDEAFLVALKRMGELDQRSREFARAHSDRLWKELVVKHDPDASASAARGGLPRIGPRVLCSGCHQAARAVRVYAQP